MVLEYVFSPPCCFSFFSINRLICAQHAAFVTNHSTLMKECCKFSITHRITCLSLWKLQKFHEKNVKKSECMLHHLLFPYASCTINLKQAICKSSVWYSHTPKSQIAVHFFDYLTWHHHADLVSSSTTLLQLRVPLLYCVVGRSYNLFCNDIPYLRWHFVAKCPTWSWPSAQTELCKKDCIMLVLSQHLLGNIH